MQTTLKNLLLGLLLVTAGYANACDKHDHAHTNGLTKETWTFKSYECPHGCSDILRKVLDQQLSTPLDLSESGSWTTGTLGACQAPLSVKTETVSRKNLLQQINGSLPPAKSLTAAKLGLSSTDPIVAEVLCTGQEGQKISGRFIQAKPGKLLSMDEEGAILIYE